jgi:hypothetical protein
MHYFEHCQEEEQRKRSPQNLSVFAPMTTTRMNLPEVLTKTPPIPVVIEVSGFPKKLVLVLHQAPMPVVGQRPDETPVCDLMAVVLYQF